MTIAKDIAWGVITGKIDENTEYFEPDRPTAPQSKPVWRTTSTGTRECVVNGFQIRLNKPFSQAMHGDWTLDCGALLIRDFVIGSVARLGLADAQNEALHTVAKAAAHRALKMASLAAALGGEV